MSTAHAILLFACKIHLFAVTSSKCQFQGKLVPIQKQAKPIHFAKLVLCQLGPNLQQESNSLAF
jgi:hypothetical protein